MRRRIAIGGLLFDSMTMEQALQRIEEGIAEAKLRPHPPSSTHAILVANQDSVNRFQRRAGVSLTDLNSAFLTVADGISVVAASRLLGRPLPQRIPGPELMDRFLHLSTETGYSHFFFGSTERVCQMLIAACRKAYPGIDIRGYYAPPRYPFSSSEDRRILETINRSGTDVLWVSLGCPKQEQWILRFRDQIRVPVTAGVGAAFDFLSGNKKRAPLPWRVLRLEWFFRLIQEPVRLFSRYVVGGFRFFILILRWGSRAAD